MQNKKYNVGRSINQTKPQIEPLNQGLNLWTHYAVFVLGMVFMVIVDLALTELTN